MTGPLPIVAYTGEIPAFVAGAPCGSSDPELFFPVSGESPLRAQKICSTCPDRVECLSWALEHDERWGVWGGLTADQRAVLRESDQ